MDHYTPTLNAGETGRGARKFVKDNHEVFVRILVTIVPFIILMEFIDIAISGLYFERSIIGFVGGQVFASLYFVPMITINWIRVIVNGPDYFEIVNPLKPKKHELQYIGMQLLLSFVALVVMGGVIAIFSVASKQLALISSPFVFVLVMYFFLRYTCFYFPAKAINNTLKFGEVYKMSDKRVGKLLLSSFFASWRLILIMIVVGIFMSIVVNMLVPAEAMVGFGARFAAFVQNAPMLLYIGPLMGMLVMTSFTNYYLYAIQNPIEGDE